MRHTGVYLDKRSGKWHAYITYQKKRYYLWASTTKEEAIEKRMAAEQMIHDPVVIDHFDSLTNDSRKALMRYLSSDVEGKRNSI